MIINKYEISGAGARQRDEEDDDYGRVYLTKCVDGDDWVNFISSPNKSYFLYWCHKLDVERFVQFTLCVLNKFKIANSTEFNIVSNMHISTIKKSKHDDDHKKVLAVSLAAVGVGIKELGKIIMEREIEIWENKLYELEDKVCEVEDNDTEEEDISAVNVKKICNMKRRIGSLKENNKDTKKDVKKCNK